MFDTLDLYTLQHIWWFLCGLIGSLFLFLNFVQGGQTLLWQVAKSDLEKSLVINSLGRKWELAFTTLVLFGGALFASFPKFYATSFGGAYWVWIAILFTFILQAVSYEFRSKPGNLLGARVYEFFLFINGSLGILLIGAALGTFFTGANFTLNEYNQVTWTTPYRGLEAAVNMFNLSLGLFLVFNARILGGMYLINNINFESVPELKVRLRREVFINFICTLPFLLIVFGSLPFISGFTIDGNGSVSMMDGKYLANLKESPWIMTILGGGLLLIVLGVLISVKSTSTKGIWSAGPGTVLIGLGLFSLAGFNNTPFYPSRVDLQSSLSIFNASSSLYTLKTMTYVALFIPVVLAYIVIVWRAMSRRKIGENELTRDAY